MGVACAVLQEILAKSGKGGGWRARRALSLDEAQ